MALKGSGGHTQTETLIRNLLRDALRDDGWYVFYVMQGLGSTPGISDLCCVKAGRTVWLEVKTPKGRLTNGQNVFERDVKRHGGEYRVAKGIRDITDMLDQRTLYEYGLEAD
ncbi:hypothetical protein FACS1894184_20960 [Clostridia bacterium]|nr:hypothetical protein FACS1894184_20960 [Clostridia bacterium]